MSRRHKEEEKTERIIRSLLKQPDNRRCINCNSLGPQYVCTTFSTFICTNCSGIHREFTHRVKSISMAKFKVEEVSALQAGGNERAKEIYLKTWDPLRNTLPDGCNLHRLRDFIKHVYVDRRYSGDKMLAIGSREENTKDRCFLERKNSNNEVSEKSLKCYMDEMRSPEYRLDSARFSSPRPRSTAKFEIVDDRFRDDASEPRRLSRRLSNVEPTTVTGLSPDPQTTRVTTILPMLQNVKKDYFDREKTVSTPKVVELLKENGDEHAQKAELNNFEKSVATKVAEPKLQKTSSSTCSSADYPQLPSNAAAPPQTPEKASSTTTTTSGNNNSSVRSCSIQKASSVPIINSSLEALFELSVTSLVRLSTTDETPSISDAGLYPPVATSNSVCTPVTPEVGPSHEQEIQSSNDSLLNSSQQQHQPDSPVLNNGSAIQQNNSSVEHYIQPWNSNLSNSPDSQALTLTATTEQSTEQTACRLSQDSGSGDVSSKSSARRELPADLFTFGYPSYNTPIPSWQYHQPSQGMGFIMHYNPASMPSNTFSSSARSRNPFDIGDDESAKQIQSQMYHSMPYPQVNAHVQPQSLPNPSATSLGSYTAQQPHNSFSLPPSRSFGSVEDSFGSFNSRIQHTNNNNYSNSTHTCPNSYTHGNPFG